MMVAMNVHDNTECDEQAGWSYMTVTQIEEFLAYILNIDEKLCMLLAKDLFHQKFDRKR